MAATLLRWLRPANTSQDLTSKPSQNSTSIRGKKRHFVDLSSDIENEGVLISADSHIKRQCIDSSHDPDDDGDDIITVTRVARAPLRVLNGSQAFNGTVMELSEQHFNHKSSGKLWVQPNLLSDHERSQYSQLPTPSTKALDRTRTQPISSNKPAATKTRNVSATKLKAATTKTKLKAVQHGSASLRKMFAPKASSSESPDVSSPVFADKENNVTPPPHLDEEDATSTRRGSKRASRVSYANMDLDDSEDELAITSSQVRGRSLAKSNKRARHRDDEDDAFMIDGEEEEEDDAGSGFDDEAELAHDLGEGSDDVDFDDDEDVDEKPRSKSTKRAQTKSQSKSEDGQPDKPKKSRARMAKLINRGKEERGVNHMLPPLSNIEDIFDDITSKALALGLDAAIKHLNARPIRVATMCSGTESPLLALEMIRDCLAKHELPALEIEHLFSAEIVPFKQAYIERNFNPPIIFRDITELTSVVGEDEPMATTAYGGKALVPKEVDIVIAGTSCVDFSALNTHQKTMDQGGESADTWTAVLSYVRAFRPAIILLENVCNADWDRMLGDYENINYDCSGAMVSTRDYYIPHVRERGYMACFDKERLAKGPAAQWKKLMEKFKRPASSPVSDFLIPNDQIVRKTIRNDEPSKEVDWRQCEITQMEYRSTNRLGYARPITHWSESGSKQPPDNGYAPWYDKQVDRVLDTIDGAVLRKAMPLSKALPGSAMYDCRFKTRIFDLSQNIYRETDQGPFGITGCITPSGMFFVTDLGRVLTSEETLKLQGIPLEKISFTTETQPEIQSLAGNAMSSTVIAASILSALIPGHRLFDLNNREARRHDPCIQDTQRKLVTGSDERVEASSSRPQSFDMNELLRRAESSARKCYCEAGTGLAEQPIQQCTECGHTTCTGCGGNPSHAYRQTHAFSNNRTTPADFQRFVRSVIPLRLTFSNTKLHEIAWPHEKYGKSASSALQGSFAFSGIRRTHCWTVTFTSEHGSALELVLSSASVVSPSLAQWRLYAAVSKTLPGDSPDRQMLVQPVARSIMLDGSMLNNSLDGSSWEVRIPHSTPRTLPLIITGSGPQVASWWSSMEMPDFTDHTVSAFLGVEVADAGADLASAINGRYQYLPRCGKASNSLYKRIEGGEPIFLFLDPSRTGEPADDCFVFSRSIELLENDEVRPVLARVNSSWRPWAKNGKNLITAQTQTELIVDHSWHSMVNCSLQASEMKLAICRTSEPAALANSADCTELAIILSCNVPSSTVRVGTTSERSFIRADDPRFFKNHAWVFEAVRRHLPDSDWHQLQIAVTRCDSCSPRRPALRWGLSADGKELRHYEDPHGAALYERSMKSRPDPIMIVVSPAGNNMPENGWTFSLGLDLGTLAHRAASRLPEGTPLLHWRFMTDSQPAFKFKPFKLRDTRGALPFDKELGMTIRLFTQQLMSLSWMRQQETGVSFTLEESEEACIKSLGWTAEVRATSTKVVRGGICADHPGFGKTITSLALIHAQFNETSASNIQAELKTRANGFLPHAGTLIVCPASLIDQWKEEINNKIQYGNQKLCVLKNVGDLTKYTIKDFQNFRIVIVNRTVFEKDAYIERLAAFAGVPGPITSKGRPYTQWLKFAHQQIPKHLKVRNSALKEDFKTHIEAVYREHVTSDDFKAAVPSKRLTGADYIAGKQKKIESLAKKAPPKINPGHLKNLDKPLLELFYWNRIIVDEFHQPEAKLANIAVATMQADKRWGLSATPALGDFYEVARMAELLGVSLRVGSDGAGIMKNSSVKELRKDMNHFELFNTLRQTPSDSLHCRIHEIDQIFLDTFVRQNIMESDKLPFQEHLVPVHLDLDHRAFYAEVLQNLRTAEMKIKKNRKGTDRDKRFHEAISSSSTAEEALSKVAAFSDRKQTCSSSHELHLDEIVRDRRKAVDSIIARLPKALAEAKGTENEHFEQWSKSMLRDGMLGDAEAVEEISKLSKAAKGVKVPKAELDRRIKDTDDYKAGDRAFTAFLNGLCKRLLVEKRSARYMENLHGIQQAAHAYPGNLEVECDSPSCKTQKDSPSVAVSALCGHTVCSTCWQQKQDSQQMGCPSHGCSSSMQHHHLFWPNEAGDLHTATPYGAKIDAAVRLLQKIESKKEQAILFVQYENQLEEIEMALKDHGIGATIVKSAEKAGTQIKGFREAAGTQQRKTVIVLNSSDETAAGSNLQNANHVIFLSPLLKDSQYGYDSTMAQTIGRARRHGQKKEIHIYRIAALDTIDVDVLEQRERRKDALVEQGAPKVPRPAALAKRAQSSERTQIVEYPKTGQISLTPRSWLIDYDADPTAIDNEQRVQGKHRIPGWKDFSSIVKFSKNFTEDDD